LAALLGFAVLAGPAFAQDPTTALSEAESQAEVASLEVGELEAAVGPAESRFQASAAQAAPVTAAAKAAGRRVAKIEGRLRARHLAAVAKVSRIKEEKRDAADKHDETVRIGLGLGLAALIAAAIAFAWDWFRASAPVAWLTQVSLGQAIGLCVGGGLLLVIVGAAMSGTNGIVGVIGVALIGLGFVLANALALARHSAEIQRGRSKPILRRERLPRRATHVTAGVFAAVCLIGLGTAVFAGETESSEASAALRLVAADRGMSTPSLVSAKGKAAKLNRKAAPLVAAAHADQRELQATQRKLSHAEVRQASAEDDAASFTRRLAVITEREERKAAAEARRAEERAQEEAEELEEEFSSECDPNYEGECLKDGIGDYDCAGGSGNGPNYVYSEVRVVGMDVFGLDANGNGIGCEGE
jgi:hypothetical protein